MNTSVQTHRGTLLLAEFSDALHAHRTDQALHPHEMRQLVDGAQAGGSIAVEYTPQKLLFFHPQHRPLLALARDMLALCARLRAADAQRHSLSARIMLGYGTVQLQEHRAFGDWTHRMSGSMAHVPVHAIAALSEFVETCPPSEFREPPRPLRPGLFLLQTTDTDSVETQLGSRLSAAELGVFTRLSLRVHGEARMVQIADCPLLIGRDKSCGVQLSSPTASRVHGRIEYLHGLFYYVDDSRNGSYLLNSDGEELHVARDRIVLAGSGAISPGAPIAEQKGEVLRYTTHSQKLEMGGDSGGDTRPLGSRR